jgi:hypothetical protein
MQLRLNYLKQLWEEGLRFQEMVWLVGDRPLDALVDKYTDCCKNEAEAARVLYNDTTLPEEMKSLPVTFVDTPKIKINGKENRPHTLTTLEKWFSMQPESCKALFISCQPFCGYQYEVVKTAAPDSIDFEVVGPGVNARSYRQAAAVTLDSLARWLYQKQLNTN